MTAISFCPANIFIDETGKLYYWLIFPTLHVLIFGYTKISELYPERRNAKLSKMLLLCKQNIVQIM